MSEQENCEESMTDHLTAITIIEAGMDGYSFAVRQEVDKDRQNYYSIERMYLYIDEEDEETWGTERQTFGSWCELFQVRGAHLFTLPPLRIHSSHREKLREELTQHYHKLIRTGVHPYWRAFLGYSDESFLPNIER